MEKKSKINPASRLPNWRVTLPLAQACPRCGAKTRRGGACKAPGMKNGRCRIHGGTSTGPRTPEGLERMRRAKTKHGRYSEGYRTMMRHIRVLAKEAREIAGDV